MKRLSLIGYRLLQVAAFVGLFMPLVWLFPSNDLNIVLDSMIISVGLGIAYSYGRGGLAWFMEYPTTEGHYLVLGILLSWTGSCTRVARLFWWRIYGRQDAFFDYWFDHWSVSLTLYLLVIGGIMHMAAHRAINNEVPVTGWVTCFVTAAAGMAAGLGFTLLD